MKKFLVAFFGCAAFSASALAADMPLKAPMAPAPLAGSWTGFYVGVAGGYGWGSTRHSADAISFESGIDDGLRGALVGLTYGYNWQIGNLVLGLEGDISWSDIKDTFNDNGSGFCLAGIASCYTKLQWLGTERARLGFSWDRWLVYATGGAAYGSVKATVAPLAPGTTITDDTRFRFGYAAGAGVEAMLAPHWSAKLEYLFVDLGTHTNYQFTAGAFTTGDSVLVRANIVRAGLNYHW